MIRKTKPLPLLLQLMWSEEKLEDYLFCGTKHPEAISSVNPPQLLGRTDSSTRRHRGRVGAAETLGFICNQFPLPPSISAPLGLKSPSDSPQGGGTTLRSHLKSGTRSSFSSVWNISISVWKSRRRRNPDFFLQMDVWIEHKWKFDTPLFVKPI